METMKTISQDLAIGFSMQEAQLLSLAFNIAFGGGDNDEAAIKPRLNLLGLDEQQAEAVLKLWRILKEYVQ